MNDDLKRRNRKFFISLLGLVVGMVTLAYASVPLYDLFCRVTGYGGTTQVAEASPDRVVDRDMRVRFVANTDRNLAWDFDAEQVEMSLKVGESGLAYYRAKNTSDRPVAGMAVYNVTPSKAGLYFNKVQCFCFDEQVLQPGEEMEMPVYFFLDPSLDEDPNMDDVRVVTLSYTFFSVDSEDLDDAIDGYYEEVEQATRTDDPKALDPVIQARAAAN